MPDQSPVEITNTSELEHQPITPGDARRLVQEVEPFLHLTQQSSPPDKKTSPSAQPFQFSELASNRQSHPLTDLPADAEVQVEIELGSMQCQLDGEMQLSPGSLVTLNSLTSEPVDIFADGRLTARGEVVTLAGQPGIRIVEIL